ncbi:hypothetical protein DSM101010T_24140 [Desulfovibrio subterraneus]|uniref:Uncharacterized protein n=1 Tax=Desulfovibrio subterraneus TaxID=2718620 RepID=A0A7J0BK83_9BACT|nr:hypothetical protein DSM101010T_24140 [Desulfovibrio subterraneus]
MACGTACKKYIKNGMYANKDICILSFMQNFKKDVCGVIEISFELCTIIAIKEKNKRVLSFLNINSSSLLIVLAKDIMLSLSLKVQSAFLFM